MVREKQGRRTLLPLLLSLLGIGIVGTGIGLELIFGGQVFLVMITAGSCFVAVGSVLWNRLLKGELKW